MGAKHLPYVARLIGYNAAEVIVYDEEISLDDYYDGEHIWDDSESTKRLGMVKLVGKLYGDAGNIFQEFESAFSPDSGDYIGGRASHDDGQVFTDGIYDVT